MTLATGPEVTRPGAASAALPRLPELSRARILLLVAALALAAFANTLGNRWAVDDEQIIQTNPVVTGADWRGALAGPYWTRLDARPALWRPTTIAFFVAEWRAFGDRPAAFHAVSVALHALVSVLVAALLATLLPAAAAAFGGALFAAHPVHVEAVANVVGQSELLAAAAYVGACLLYLATRRPEARRRLLRVPLLAVLYALALGAKEIAVTLPAALLLLGALVPEPGEARETSARVPVARRLGARLRDDAPLLLALGAVAVAYLVVRVWVLGAVTGENVPSALLGLGADARALTAFSLWPTYLRLLLVPFGLSSDYGPAVLMPATGLRPDVLAGTLCLSGLVAAAVGARAVAPWAALASGWLVLTILPVSNLFFPAGTMLAERTLYLPSLSVSLAAGGALALVAARAPLRLREAWMAAALVLVVFLVRSVVRNPTWQDSFTVMSTLAREHPEAVTAHRARAAGLVQVGDLRAALREYDTALAVLPDDYGLLIEAGSLSKRARDLQRAEPLLARAIRVDPDRPIAYRLLAELYLLAGDGRRAHAVALAGLARWGADHDLWALVSESYVAKGDLPAAVRAREAALAQDPGRESDRVRLVQLLEAQSRTPTHENAR